MNNSCVHLRLCTAPVIVLLTLLGGGCDKQSIGSNAEAATNGDPAESGQPSSGSDDDIPDCGENFCPGTDCISRCEDDATVDGCWYRCEPGEVVDCWGGCENESDNDDIESVPPFDPLPDVGDGSLEEDLLVVAEFNGLRFYISLEVERLGDTFQGQARSASLVDGTWSFGPAQPINVGGAVVDNEVNFRIEDYTFASGHHPFTQEAVVLDIALQTRIHTEEILCGVMFVDRNGEETLAPVTIAPFPWTAEDGSQLVMCP